MPDYKAMYLDLFNAVTDAIEMLGEAQRKAEETYINTSVGDEERGNIIKLVDLSKK